PEYRGLALIGYADRSKVCRAQAFFLHGFVNNFLYSLPDFVGVVLDPARLRKNLLVLFLCDSRNAAHAVEDDEASAGCALVNRTDIVGHTHESFRRYRAGFAEASCGRPARSRSRLMYDT